MPETQRKLSYDIDALFVNGSVIGGVDVGETPSSQNTFYDGVGAGAIVDGNFISNFNQVDGAIFSGKTTFNNTETGYRLGLDAGTAKFYIGDSTTYLNWTGSSLVIVGTITASTGTIGGFTIDTDNIRDAANSFGMASTVSGGDDVRFWAGDTFANRATADFRVTEAGAVTASSMTITGGAITGTPIASIPNNTSTDISLLDFTHDLVFSETDADTVAWASGTITMSNGRTFSITGSNTGNMSAKTYIYLDTGVSSTALQTTTTVATAMGANKKLIAVAQNGTGAATWQVNQGIGGLKITAAMSSIANNDWAYSGTWSVTDSNTIAWGAGTLTTSNGGSYSITGSNTGNMAAKTYIYFALGTSSTAFQTTTTAATAIGEGKILIAIAQNGTAEASYIVMNDKQHNIDAANIVAGSITANEISASTITSDKLSVSQLSAIAADLGTITAGSISINGGVASINSSGVATFTSGTIGGWTLSSSILTSSGPDSGIKLNAGTDSIRLGAAVSASSGIGVYLGLDAQQTGYDFRAGNPAGAYVLWDASASTLTVNGGTIQTTGSGTRFAMTSTTFRGFDSSDDVVFEILLSGGNAGDVIMGDDATGSYAQWDNSAGTFEVFADNVPTTTQGFFGGDGSDGALSITSGTTTLSFASANVLIKNYTTISITSTGKLGFSNPASNGSVAILKSQGNCTVTSSSSSVIDLRSMGAAGGGTGADGTSAFNIFANNALFGNKAETAAAGAGGTALPASEKGFYITQEYELFRRFVNVLPGSGGGGGSGGTGDGTGGPGGRGGGALIIECGGAWNFTTGTITTAGAAGTDGTSGTQAGAGGGGGGSGGMVLVLYNTLTANSGTIADGGGAGGNGASGTATNDEGQGGGGAASYHAAGGTGGEGDSDNGDAAGGSMAGGGGAAGGDGAAGGTGGAGGAAVGGLVVANKYFA